MNKRLFYEGRKGGRIAGRAGPVLALIALVTVVATAGSETDETALFYDDELVFGLVPEIGESAGEGQAHIGRLAGGILYQGLDKKVIDIPALGVENVEENSLPLDDGRCLNPNFPVHDMESNDVRIEFGRGRSASSGPGDSASSAPFYPGIRPPEPADDRSLVPDEFFHQIFGSIVEDQSVPIERNGLELVPGRRATRPPFINLNKSAD